MPQEGAPKYFERALAQSATQTEAFMKRHRALPWLLVFGIVAVGIALNWPLPPEPAPRRNARAIAPFRAPGIGGPEFGAPGMRRPRRWRETTAQERRDATASIVAQLDACKRNDFQRAMLFQSTFLRRRFASVAAFRQMMQAYPQFMRYKSVRFGKSRATRRGRLLQIEVDLTGMDNVRAKALYLMVLENKNYRVAGVEGGRSLPPQILIPNPISSNSKSA
jgi:hypothetical protein